MPCAPLSPFLLPVPGPMATLPPGEKILPAAPPKPAPAAPDKQH